MMKKWILVVCCFWVINSSFAGEEQPQRVDSEVFQGNQLHKALPSLRLIPPRRSQRSATASTSAVKTQWVLPTLDATELQSLQNLPVQKALPIGIGRDLPSSIADVTQWDWQSVGDGQVAHFSLRSSGALRIRAYLQLESLPPGVELRIYAPQDTNVVFGPYLEAGSAFWTPSIAGDELALELFIPGGIQPQEVVLQIPRLSHLVADPAQSQLKSMPFKNGVDYTSCQVDVACAAPEWQELGKSVARYVYTSLNGTSRLCSGTLLADTDQSTQIPYFFTAAHCIQTPEVATSMDFFWFYRNDSCGGNIANFQQSSGGAEALDIRLNMDTSFLRLNNSPPSGAVMSGWLTTPRANKQIMTGIHHAMGLPQKYAQGYFNSYVRVEANGNGYISIQDPKGAFTQVKWQQGITAPGSSGSGVWVKENGKHYLSGSLVGGSSSCTAQNNPDEYSRFDYLWPHISQWLDNSGAQASLWLRGADIEPSALIEGVIITRYLRGNTGNDLISDVVAQPLDTAKLELALARLQPKLDIDGNGQLQDKVDGELVIRFLLGLRGNNLLSGFDLSGASRSDASSIENYLSDLIIQK